MLLVIAFAIVRATHFFKPHVKLADIGSSINFGVVGLHVIHCFDTLASSHFTFTAHETNAG